MSGPAHVGALALLLQLGALAEQPARLAGLALYLGQQLAADEGVAAPHRLHLHPHKHRGGLLEAG